MKRIISVLLSLILLISSVILVNAVNEPTISVIGTSAGRGDTVTVEINIENNPGLVAMKLNVNYDASALTLTGVTDGGIFGASSAKHGTNYAANPYVLKWEDNATMSDHHGNGTLATLTFTVSESAQPGDAAISVSVDENSTYNLNIDDFVYTTVNGAVTVIGEDEPSYTSPTIAAGSVTAEPGDTVSVPVMLYNNPGIIAMRISLSYDSRYLTLVGAEDAGLLGTGTGVFGDDLTQVPYTLLWEDGLARQNHADSGLLVTLTFAVSQNAKGGSLPISITVSGDSTFNVLLQDVPFETEPGEIIIDSDSPIDPEPEITEPSICVDSKLTFKGDTVDLPIRIINNPGIVALRFSVIYDSEILSLQGVQNGEVFGTETAAFGNNLSQNPYILLWEDSLSKTNYTQDGVLAILTFHVENVAAAGETTVSIRIDEGSTFDVNLDDVAFDAIPGTLTLDGITSTPQSAKIYVGETVQLSTAVKYGLTEETAVTWSSSNPLVASVDAAGVVTGHRRGNVIITATDENGNMTQSHIQVWPLNAEMQIFSFGGDFDQKVNWWKKYTTASMDLGFLTFNCEEAARYVWSSSSSRVHIDQDGHITNTGIFSRKSEITLTAYNANDEVVAEETVTVRFYKFSWQRRRLQSQSIVSDNVFMQAQSAETLEAMPEENEAFISFFSFLLERVLVGMFVHINN